MEEKSSYSQNSHPKQPKGPRAGKSWRIHEIGIAAQRQSCGALSQPHPGMGSCAWNSVKWKAESPGLDRHAGRDGVRVRPDPYWKGGGGCKSLYLNVPWLFYFPVKWLKLDFFFFKHSLMAKYVFPWNWNLAWWFYILKAFIVTHSWPGVGFCNTPQAQRAWVSCFLGLVRTHFLTFCQWIQEVETLLETSVSLSSCHLNQCGREP